MKPSRFVLYEPTSVDQAVFMLSEVADQDGRILAGGQTLIPAMALRLAQPSYLIDINRIAQLQSLVEHEQHLCIYAGVRHAAFHQPAASGPLGALLSTVVRHIAHLPIRNRGTFVGSVANADPASEWCLVTATLDGVIVARSLEAERRINARDYFLGFMTTALRPNELLVAVELPLLDDQTRFGFEEVSWRAGDFAQAMALAAITFTASGMSNVRIGVGGAESTPRRITAAETLLEGRQASPDVFAQAARCAAEDIEPMDGTSAEQDYKRSLVETVVLRALEKAAAVPPAHDQHSPSGQPQEKDASHE